MIKTPDILGARVLIVDDLEANVRLLERLLRGAGYTGVTSTMDPRTVVDLHRKNAYDLILLDLEMPGMDGFEVMDGLKELEAEGYVPVLVITAQPEHKLRALKGGAKDFLSKPIDLAELSTRVHNLLEVRLLHREAKRLYALLLEEQQVSERLLRNVLPRSVAEQHKADSSISELLRLASAVATDVEAEAGRHRRSTKRLADGMVLLVVWTVVVASVPWWSLSAMPVWVRALASIAGVAGVIALFYAWSRRFVAGEMSSEARHARALAAGAEQQTRTAA